MLFEQRFAEGIAAGSIDLTFRRWKRNQVVAGRRYRTAAGMIEVEAVDVVEPSAITDREAVRSGYPSATALVADLRGSDGQPVYRVRFHGVREPDPRDELAAAADLDPTAIAEIDRRLDRLDRAARSGAWTAATLACVAANPEVRAADLAEQLGRERDALKLDIRKLKNLGLTTSLERGYRLSPRGIAYVARTSRPSP